MKKIIITALLAATCAISASASAEVINLDGSFGSKLSTGTYNNVFKSGLTGQYDVNSFKFSFTFTDFGDTVWNAGEAYDFKQGNLSDSSYSWLRLRWENSRENTQHVDMTSLQETASLMFGNTELKSDGTEKKTWTKDYSVDEVAKNGKVCVWGVCSPNYTTTTTTTTYHKTDYTGPFTISGIVSDKNIIDQLFNNGDLSLSLKIFGNLKLTDSKVSLDYTKVEEPAEQPGEVPEPSSVLLAGAGLAAIGFLRRRRNAAQA